MPPEGDSAVSRDEQRWRPVISIGVGDLNNGGVHDQWRSDGEKCAYKMREVLSHTLSWTERKKTSIAM